MIGKEIRETLHLGLPLMLAQLGQMSMSFIDTLMVGRLGGLDLAGVALAGAILHPVTFVCLGVLMAVGPLVSQAHGARDPSTAGRAVRQGLWLGLLLALPAVVLMWNARLFLEWMGHDPEIVSLAQAYLRAILWGAPALFLFGALRHFVEGVSRPRVVMIITTGGVILNVVANYVLMFGKLGLPALGLVGCGWASALVYWGMLVALLFFIHSHQDFHVFGVFSRLGAPDPHVFREIFRVGWPIGIMQFLEVSLFAATAMLMGLFGAAQLAAHQIVLNCAGIVYMMPLGLSFAVSVRVGQAVGRTDSRAARRAGYTGMALGACFMTCSAVVFWLAPRRVLALFLDMNDPANFSLIEYGAVLLSLAAVFQIFDGIQANSAGALRGLKETRMPMVLALVAYWLVGFPCGWYLAFRLGWEGEGLWWGLVLGLATAAILLSLRFRTEIAKRPATE